MTIPVTPARLDDTRAIAALFQAPIEVWQRIAPDGRGETVPYDALTLYERWLHGGAWMAVETGAIWLNHLIAGAGIALVTPGGSGYAEAFVTSEPDPIGRVLHLHHLIAPDDETRRALLLAVNAEAKKQKCTRVTITCITADAPFSGAHFSPITSARRYTLSARQGNVFFRAVEHNNADPGQIVGWAMPLGRASSARAEWELLWNRQFDTLPEIAARRPQRLALAVAGQDAFIHIQRNLYDPRMADVAAWSPKPLTPQVVSAVRDWAHREGYRSLRVLVHDEDRPALGADADADGYVQQVCAVTLA